jgi:hypothetical protein
MNTIISPDDRPKGFLPPFIDIIVIETATGKLKEIRKMDTKTGKQTIVKKNATIYKEYEAKNKV